MQLISKIVVVLTHLQQPIDYLSQTAFICIKIVSTWYPSTIYQLTEFIILIDFFLFLLP